MNPRNKVFLVLLAALAVLVIIACSCTDFSFTTNGGGDDGGNGGTAPEPIPGLAGQWEDQYELTVHTIEWTGTKYVVTESWNPDRGTYEILEQSWDGSSLNWVYRVPDGADVTLETISVTGDELYLNWWSTNGNSGQDTFLRYP
jgi:hypothetical protein